MLHAARGDEWNYPTPGTNGVMSGKYDAEKKLCDVRDSLSEISLPLGIYYNTFRTKQMLLPTQVQRHPRGNVNLLIV